MQKTLLHIILVSLICSWIGCKKEATVAPVQESEPTQFRNAFFPLAVGNSWSYADTGYSVADTVVYRSAVEVVDTVADAWGKWWVLKSTMNDHASGNFQRMVHGDTVYAYVYGQFSNFPAALYIDPGETTIHFCSMLGGDYGKCMDVSTYAGVIHTGAGDFEGCIESSTFVGFGTDQTYFKRGVGVVATIRSYLMFGEFPVTHYQSERLLSYNLKDTSPSPDHFYPVAIGNTWSYVDSSMQYADSASQEDRLKIGSYSKQGNDFVWWCDDDSTTNRFKALPEGILERNDSVFSVSRTGATQLVFYNLPPNVDSSKFSTANEKTSIRRVSESYPIGDGTNVQCLMVEKGNRWYLVAPHVGIVRFCDPNVYEHPPTTGLRGRLFHHKLIR